MDQWASGLTTVDFGTEWGPGSINGAIGAVAGMGGGEAAGWASKHIGSFAINSLGVAGKSAIGGFVQLMVILSDRLKHQVRE